MKPYFSKFPKMRYDMEGDNKFRFVTNITHRARLREKVKDNSFIYYEWTVRDGETPEIIAEKYYESSQFHWLVLFSNDMLNPYYDWVMSDKNFNAFIVKKYGSHAVADLTLHHFEDVNGYEVDRTTYEALPEDERGDAVSCRDYEVNLNESKRNIKLISSEFAARIDKELDKLMSESS